MAEASRDRGPWASVATGLVGAPLLAALAYFLIPSAVLDADGQIVSGLSAGGRAVAATGVLMGVLWLTEALPVAVTSLLPLVAIPLLTGGDIAISSVAAPYANPNIFLFLGGFMIALSMQSWGLHRRLALHIILLVGSRPDRLVLGFMAASAFLSMWISNTATTVMMLPIALSVIDLVRQRLGPDVAPVGRPFPFALNLLLGTAYGASIGGVATKIGTPPNLQMMSFVEDTYGREISFAQWMPFGLLITLSFLPLAWLVLTRFVYRLRITEVPGGRELIRGELLKLGRISGPEKTVLAIFVSAALLWTTRTWLTGIEIGGSRPLSGLTDPGIAIGASLLLFAIPVDFRRGVFLLSWKKALEAPWGILLLFGGGLSLAAAVVSTGVDRFIGGLLLVLEGMPVLVLVIGAATLLILLTEVTSNTATTATFLPILGATAAAIQVDPLLLIVPATLAASCAFMMPVATPPNAIVFGSGEITIPQMVRAGLWLNLIGLALIVFWVYVAGGLIGL
ncbi:MAG: SLC13 family permease [Acidobacteria bacterium]|nr:SLC13 family permease [Acidobacteriota bacterium]MCY3964481.1 SLC13 family permease [Acidobacteriota bacterium]